MLKKIYLLHIDFPMIKTMAPAAGKTQMKMMLNIKNKLRLKSGLIILLVSHKELHVMYYINSLIRIQFMK